MKTIFITLIFLLANGFNVKAQDVKNNSAKEPKTNLEVTINGKKMIVTEEETFIVDSTLVKPSISIKLSAFKKFDISAISFDYPKHLSFEFEQDYGYKNWTLSGNSFTVMVFEMDAKTTLNSIMAEMIKKFGKKNTVIEDFEKELGGRKFDGKKLTVSLVGQKLEMECYEILLDDYKSRFIYFQDLITDNQNSDEYLQGLSKIRSSIKFN
ncbi:MAG: hypothetical protein ABIO79_10625 [Ferruginibacter sp.]